MLTVEGIVNAASAARMIVRFKCPVMVKDGGLWEQYEGVSVGLTVCRSVGLSTLFRDEN